MGHVLLAGKAVMAITSAGGAATASAPKIPLSPFDAFNTMLQDHLGKAPVWTYLAWFVTTYVVAAILALKFRGSLMKDWTALGSWLDKVVVTCLSTETDPKISNTLHGSVALYKGSVLLEWPDGNLDPLVMINESVLTVTEWGGIYQTLSIGLCNTTGFISFAAVQVAILFVLLTIDQPNLWDSSYLPHLQIWFVAIYLWPALLAILQYMLLPTWQAKLAALESDTSKLSRQFNFQPRDVRIHS